MLPAAQSESSVTWPASSPYLQRGQSHDNTSHKTETESQYKTVVHVWNCELLCTYALITKHILYTQITHARTHTTHTHMYVCMHACMHTHRTHMCTHLCSTVLAVSVPSFLAAVTAPFSRSLNTAEAPGTRADGGGRGVWHGGEGAWHRGGEGGHGHAHIRCVSYCTIILLYTCTFTHAGF